MSETGETMTALPANLMFGASVLSSYNRNRFRLETTSADTAGDGRIVTINLPENALLDMKSFRFFFDVEAGSNDSVIGLIPAHAASLISRVEVYVNGVQVQQGTSEYNTIYNMLQLGRGNQDAVRTKSRLISHGSLYSSGGTALATALGTAGISKGEQASLCVDNWLGFLNETSTRFLPTDLLGQVQVRLTFAPNSVLSAVGTAGSSNCGTLSAAQLTDAPGLSYTIRNMFFSVDSIVVGDAYNQLLRSKLMGAGSFLPLNYKEYYTFSHDGISSTSYSNRFSLSAGSIDKLYAVQRGSLGTWAYNAIGAATCNAPAVADGVSPLEAIGDPLVGKYFTFVSAKGGASDSLDGALRYQWSINNVQHPQYLARMSEAMADMGYTNGKTGFDTNGIIPSSPSAFCRSMAVFSLQLNHPELGLSVQSGYNSRGINSTMSFAMQGLSSSLARGGVSATSNIQSLVCVETTSQLRISAGKALAVSF